MSKRPVLHSTLRAAGLLATLSVIPLTGWCAVAGQFQFVAGDVRILGANGQSRPAQKGQDISEGETIVTGANASAQLKMIDGGLLALRPDSQLKMDAYVFKGREDGSEKANMSLVKGGLRAISGLIGKTNKQNYAINTPTATIGIRGTDHEPVVVLPPPPGQSAPNPPGTYDKVNVGATILSNLAGSTIVNPNQVGFAGAPNLAPALLPRVPDFYRVTPLPSQRQQPQSSSQSSNNSSTGQTSNPGSNSESSTTNAASGSAGGDAMRVNTTDTPANTGNTVGAGSGNVANASVTVPVTTTTTTTVLTAENGQGAKVNLSNPGNDIVLTGSQVSEVKGHFDLVFGGLTDATSYLYSSKGQSATLRMQGDKLVAVSLLEDLYRDVARVFLGVDGTLTDTGSNSATGLYWGRWSSGQLKYTVSISTDNEEYPFLAGALPAGGMHYIVGTKPAPEYLARVLIGTYNYNKIGGTSPTDMAGRTGVLTNASMQVNFTSQLVEQAIIGFTMPDSSWSLTATNMPLEGSGQFQAQSGSCTSGCGSLSVVKTVGNTASNQGGRLQGTLSGSNLNGAAISYQTYQTTTSLLPDANLSNTIQGVAALSVDGTAPDATTAYRATGISSGWKMSSDSGAIGDNPYDPSTIATLTGATYKGTVEGGEGPVARILTTSSTDNPPNALTEFVGRAEYMPTSGTELVTSSGQNSITAKIGTATNREVGSTTVDGMTVSWGRWAGGTVDIYDRAGTTKLGTIDNSDRSLHWLASSSVSGPIVTLPVTGSATYNLAGATSPTDTHNNTGTLNSATVTANFSTMRVDANVALSINATNIGITANNMVLGSGGGFSSNDRFGASPATVTCSGGCGPGSTGYINGQLLGQNASGAAIAYGAALGSNVQTLVPTPSMVVNGVAVLKR